MRPIHGRRASLFITDPGSSGQLDMPVKGAVTLDTTNDLEARQRQESSPVCTTNTNSSSNSLAPDFVLDALLGMKHTSLPPWCCSAGAQEHPSLVSGCCYRNAQVEPQQHGMIVQEYEQDRHVRATVGKQESWLGDH